MFILPFTYRNPNLATCYFTLLQLTPFLNESKSSADLRETGSAFYILPAENLNVFFPDDFTWGKTTDRKLFLVKKRMLIIDHGNVPL